MAKIRRIVLDVMKPHKPGIIEFATQLSDLKGIEGTNTCIVEIDREVENIKITIEGEDIDFEKVKETVENLGGSIHSVDQVICGQHIIEEIKTPQG